MTESTGPKRRHLSGAAAGFATVFAVAAIDEVRALAGALGRPVEERAAKDLALWLTRMAEWNARIDLTAAKGGRAMCELMLSDALVLTSALPEGAAIVDVGTGAGAPGLALALLRPDLRVTLIEPLQKRVSFLRTVLGEVGRLDVTLVRGRGEEHVEGAAWDVAVSRATLPPSEWLALGLELAPAAWVLLAREAPPPAANATLEETVEYTLPWSKAGRTAVRYLRSEGR